MTSFTMMIDGHEREVSFTVEHDERGDVALRTVHVDYVELDGEPLYEGEPHYDEVLEMCENVVEMA